MQKHNPEKANNTSTQPNQTTLVQSPLMTGNEAGLFYND